MNSKNRSRSIMKENRIPIGKKKENIEKMQLKKNKEPELVVDHITSKTKTLKTSKITKKTNNTNECKPLKVVNINVEPTDTSLIKPIQKPKIILSTIKELKEFEEKSNTETILNKIKTVNDDTPTLIEKENNLQGDMDINNFNNTIDEMKPIVPEIVLSPFVCTTRGLKWKPSPRKAPKLSELYDKYEDDNIADNYRKKLDRKTIELQNKVKYWAELSSGNGSDIPQSVKDEIDVVCGQTKLLTTDKFMQMRSLVNEFDNKSGQMLITTDDLDGFWDMLLLQVEKLEGQFNQLVILEKNNWLPLKPIAKKVINRLPTVTKRPVVKSKFADFIKNQGLKEKKAASNNEHFNEKNDSNKFNKMKLSNNTYLTSSTPTSSNQKNISFTPVLLKTMELSYVARRSGMTPIVLGTPHVSPLKPALKNSKNVKWTKSKKIKFESPKNNVNGFVTPENSCNEEKNYQTIQNRVVTPHALKTSKVNQNNIRSRNNPTNSSTTNQTGNKMNLKRTVEAQSKKKKTVIKTSVDVQDGKSSIRFSSRLANKPSKNYKC